MDSSPKNATLPRMGVTFKDQTCSSNYGTTGRPISYYDNILRESRQRLDQCSMHSHQNGCLCQVQAPQQRSPTQVPLLSTTVPQKIGSEAIGSRHEPTRNSLRHSRMIVMGKIGQEVRNYTPPHSVQSTKLQQALVGLQTLIGVALVMISLSILLWAPNLRTRDNPYWSGLPLLISGIIGLILLCCCSKYCREGTDNFFVNGFRVLSILISAVAGVTCFIACAFAVIHIISLTTMDCGPLNQLNATCFCKVPLFNETSLPIRSYHYVDLNCPEVHHILIIIIVLSCSSSLIGGILALWYVYEHWKSRYYNYRYLRVSTKGNRTNT